MAMIIIIIIIIYLFFFPFILNTKFVGRTSRSPPVAQKYHVTSDTLGREFDPGKRDFSH